MKGGPDSADSAKAYRAGDGPVNPLIGGVGGTQTRPDFQMRARGWNLALLAAVAAVVALSEPSGASSELDIERAIALTAEGRLGEAREALDRVLDLRFDHPRARLLDGILRAREGHVDQAIEVFERLGHEHPEMPEPWNNLAVLFAAKGRLLDARDALEEALARDPDLSAAHANLSDVYSMLARHSRTRARVLGSSAEGGSSGETREGSRLPGPEEIPAPISAAPSPAGAETGGPSSPGADDSPYRAAPVPGRADASDAENLAKRSSKSERDARWQGFLTLPGTSDSAASAAGAVSASSPAGHDTSRGSGSVPAPAATCILATGFGTARAVDEAEAWLRSRGVHDIGPLREERTAPRNHRVYLPPLESRAAAVAAVYEIRARGIRDVAIINAGPLRNGVSLGVYRSAENALRRVARMEGLGYRVRHAPGETGRTEYAIAARVGGDTFPRLHAAWRERFPDRSLEPADCV